MKRAKGILKSGCWKENHRGTEVVRRKGRGDSERGQRGDGRVSVSPCRLAPLVSVAAFIRHRASSMVLLLLILISGSSYAQDVYIHTDGTYTSVRELLTVDVMVRNIMDLSAFEFCISFDKDILGAVSVARGLLWDGPGYLWHAGEIDDTSGIISFVSGAAYSGPNPVGVSVDANGDVLAVITFQAMSAGTSSIALTDVLMYDINGHQISMNIANAEVTINTPPSASDLSIAPSSPSTTDDLAGSYTYSDVDNDPEGATEVRWYRDGVLQSAYNDTLIVPSSATSGDEGWYFTVTPHDGKDYGTLQTSSTVTIGNTAPTASDLSISPVSPSTADDLLGSYIYSDIDNDPEGNTEVRWYKDSVLQTAHNDILTVPSTATSGGEEWYFTVRPHDGKDYGTLQTSPTMTVRNTPPTASDLSIAPSSPSTTDDLLGSYVYSDVDNDPEGATEVRWYRDGVLQIAYNNVLIVPSTVTSGGEEWYFTVTPHDGKDYGTLQTSPTVTVGNTPPIASDLSTAPSSPSTADYLTGSYTYSDVDNDPEGATEVRWYKDGVLQTAYNDLLAVPSVATSKGETWHFTVRPSDGASFGALQTSSSVTVANTVPVASNLSITPASPKTGDDLVGSYDYSDADGDPETGSEIRWYRNSILQTAYSDILVVPSSATSSGDEWHFTARPCDGTGYGTFQTSPSVTIESPSVTAEAGGPYSGEEGSPITFDGSGSSGTDGTVVSYEWDFGDGTAGAGITTSHVYADNGTYTVTLTVTDDNGTTDTDTATAAVENIAPTEVDAGPDQTISEGGSVNLSGSFTDPGSGDTHTIEWDPGDGSGKLSGTLTPTHVYTDNGVYAVTLTVTDDDGGVGTDTCLVTVDNVAPSAEAGGPYSGITNQSITFTGSGTDPGTDTLTYSWDLGDGSPPKMGQKVSHAYSASGIYTATLTVTDDDNGEQTDTAEVTVNPAATPTIYVNIDMSIKTAKGKWEATAAVTVRDTDASGSTIGGAQVYGHWDGAHTSYVSEETRGNGTATFKTGWIRTWGAISFTVDKVLQNEQEYTLSGASGYSMSNSPIAEGEFLLAQSYPNPSNPDTWIPFAIGEDCEVTIKIYDVTGKLMRTLDLGYLDAGVYMDKGRSAYWDGKDENGETVSSAVYFYVMEAGEYRAARKMLIVR